MATARRTGTNEHISTFGGAGRDFTVLSTWEAKYDVNLTTMWKVAISAKSGAFTQDEVLNFTGGAAGVYIDDNGAWMIFTLTSGTPAVNDTITGATSGKTAHLDSITFQNGVSPVLECYNDAASFDVNIAMNGATTSASYFRILRPAPGSGTNGVNFHGGIPTTGIRFISTTDANMMLIQEATDEIQDVCAKLTINSTSTRRVFISSAAGYCVGCIAFDSSNAGTGIMPGFSFNAGGVIDCMAHNCEVGIEYGGTANAFFYNCTSTDNAGYGFSTGGPGGTGTFINCLARGNGTNGFQKPGAATMVVTYSASNDATADDWAGAGCRINQTFTFVDSANDNFHLASNDAGALGFGTNLSADGTFPFNDDIDKQVIWGTWDIGFDKYTTIKSVEGVAQNQIGKIAGQLVSVIKKVAGQP